MLNEKKPIVSENYESWDIISEVFCCVTGSPLPTSGVSVSVFLSVFFYVGSVFGIGILKYRDIGIGIRYFAIIYNFWCNAATAMSVQLSCARIGLWITLQATALQHIVAHMNSWVMAGTWTDACESWWVS